MMYQKWLKLMRFKLLLLLGDQYPRRRKDGDLSLAAITFSQPDTNVEWISLHIPTLTCPSADQANEVHWGGSALLLVLITSCLSSSTMILPSRS